MNIDSDLTPSAKFKFNLIIGLVVEAKTIYFLEKKKKPQEKNLYGVGICKDFLG